MVGDTSKEITVTNRGNVAMTVTGAYNPEEDYSMIAGEIDGNSASLGSADNNLGEGEGVGQVTKATLTLKISGAPETELSNIKVGSVTLTVAKQVSP